MTQGIIVYIVLVSGVCAPEGHTDIGIDLGTCAVKAHPVMQIEFLILFFGSQHHDAGSSAANLGDLIAAVARFVGDGKALIDQLKCLGIVKSLGEVLHADKFRICYRCIVDIHSLLRTACVRDAEVSRSAACQCEGQADLGKAVACLQRLLGKDLAAYGIPDCQGATAREQTHVCCEGMLALTHPQPLAQCSVPIYNAEMVVPVGFDIGSAGFALDRLEAPVGQPGGEVFMTAHITFKIAVPELRCTANAAVGNDIGTLNALQCAGTEVAVVVDANPLDGRKVVGLGIVKGLFSKVRVVRPCAYRRGAAAQAGIIHLHIPDLLHIQPWVICPPRDKGDAVPTDQVGMPHDQIIHAVVAVRIGVPPGDTAGVIVG